MDRPGAGHAALPAERGGHNQHIIMRLPASTGPGMPGMAATVVDNFEGAGGEGRTQRGVKTCGTIMGHDGYINLFDVRAKAAVAKRATPRT